MSDGKGGTFRKQKVVGKGSGSYEPPKAKEETPESERSSKERNPKA